MISGLEKQELGNRIRGMTEDEVVSLLRDVPTRVLHAEIGRRIERDQECIARMRQVLED